MSTVLVLAKAPFPGRSKTRLAPRFGTVGAARLAAAALQDTLEAVVAAPADRRVLVLDGRLADADVVGGVHVPPGVEVTPQASGSHAARIAAALAACRGPAVLIGMDTPHLEPALLALDGRTGAWLGPAEDGGWWALGLRDPRRHAAAALDGVPMSVPWTGAAQHTRLTRLGLTVAGLPVLRDVDTPDDAVAVARLAPGTHFARALDDLMHRQSHG